MKTAHAAGALAFVMTMAIGGLFAGTNVWKGPSSGGLWRDQANWSAPLTPTESTIYDFSALADGAIVTNTYEYSDATKQLVIGGLVFGEGQGRVTLFGEGTSQTIVKSGTFLVPTGTTLVLSLLHSTTPWQDYQSTIVLSGGGSVVFDGDKFRGTSWMYYFSDAEGMRVSLGGKKAFELSSFAFYSPASAYTPANDVRLQLTADTLVAAIYGNYVSSVKNFIDQGAYDLRIGYTSSSESYEATTGTGELTYEGGGRFTLRAAPRNTGGITVRNADVHLGRIYWNSSPKTSTAGPVQVPESTDLDIENCGRLVAYCDQVLAALRGEGTWGSVSMVSNWNGIANLTVGGADSPAETVFNGRLTGLGGLTKRGSDYSLVMTGANDYDGTTSVEEGTLVLRRPVDAADAPAVHMDFADETDWAAGVDGVVRKENAAGVARVAQGLSGCGAGALKFDLQAAEKPYFSYKLAPGVEPVCAGNRRFTEIVWIRPGAGCKGGQGDQRYVLANGKAWQSGHQWVRVYFNFSTNFNFTVGAYAWDSPAAADGFAAKVGEAELYDGRWHQVAVTWGEGNVLAGYFDGRQLGSVTLGQDLALPNDCQYNLGFNSGVERFDGEMDEVRLFRRALTADEIAADYTRSRRVLEVGTGLPSPVACWKFNGTNPGEDSSGNGYDLVAASGTPSTTDVFPGAFGKTLAARTGVKWAGAAFPAKIPTGAAPFTVSCRYKYYDSWSMSPLVVWGDPTKANGYFLLGTDESQRRRPMIGYGLAMSSGPRASVTYTNIVHCSVGSNSEVSWMHLVCTYDGSMIRMYQDGREVHEPIRNVALDIAADKLSIGCIPEFGSVFRGTIDDVRIFDCALTADQVRSFTRTLATDAEPPVLPSDAKVTVAAGATLAIEGTTPVLGALSCAGTLRLGRHGSYSVEADDSITGQLSGCGHLRVADRNLTLAGGSQFAGTLVASNAAVSVVGGLGSAYVNLLAGASLAGAGLADVTLSDGAVIDVDVTQPNLPGLATTGELKLAERVTVRLSANPGIGELKIASAGRLLSTGALDGWTTVDANGNPSSVRLRFRVKGNEVVAKVSGGCVLVFR